MGLTGGIGAGKSTVARMLAERGAVVVDGDRIARELVEPDRPALGEIVERFGAEVLRADGTLDRARLAGLVFGDAAALADLEAILHPRIAERAAELLGAAERAGRQVAVHDVPLLVEKGMAGSFDLVVVVQAPVPVRVARLCARGMSESDARQRMASQATDDERAAVADIVIDNSGDEAALAAAVDRAWVRIAAERGA